MNNELQHHGVLGMKWGVRRYQNKDGTLTNAGKKRYNKYGISDEDLEYGKKEDAMSYKYNKPGESGWKGLGRAVAANKNKIILGATVATAAVYVHKNPDAIGKVVSKFKNVRVSDIKQKAVDKGKDYVKNAMKGAKDGVKEGIKDAPKKAAKAVVTGVVLNQTKKALDSVVGKEESAKIFQANDNKKIGKFWKVSPDDKDDDD